MYQYSVPVYYCYYYLAELCSLWDLSSLTRDQTEAPAVKAPSPNPWTARELPVPIYYEVVLLRMHEPHFAIRPHFLLFSLTLLSLRILL